MGFKYNIRLVNQVGVIDADYYNNKNNEGKETINFKAGEAIAQGIFLKYLITKSDSDLGLERESDY